MCFRIRDLLADERCTGPVLDILHTTGVGSRVGPRAAPTKTGDEEAGERRSGGKARDEGLERAKAEKEGEEEE